MDKKLQKKLLKKYPDLLKSIPGETVTPIISCRDGWYSIIDNLLAIIKEYTEQNPEYYGRVNFTQIKEKFGVLRAYYNISPWNSEDIISKIAQQGTADFVNHMIRYAVFLSGRTCERCGSVEKVGTTEKGWLQTLCKPCAMRLKKTNPGSVQKFRLLKD